MPSTHFDVRRTELLQNLWGLLCHSVREGHIDAEAGQLAERTELLKGNLNRLQADYDRPSTAASARASLLLMKLVQTHADRVELKHILNDFKTLLGDVRGLVEFPAAQFIEILTEFGGSLASDDAFDEMFESLVEIARARESSTVSGRMLLRRGAQKLRGGMPYEAIRLLGRAQQDLALHESRGEMAAALGLCGAAYERVGLLWAARGSMLVGADQALKASWENGEISVQALACVRKLIWIELQLGRIPWVIALIDTFRVVSGAAEKEEARQKSLKEAWMNLDGALGFLILKTPVLELKQLSALPHMLNTLQLGMARMALLYVLGYEDRLRAEGYIPENQNAEAVKEFFTAWYRQPGLQDLPNPELLNTQAIELHSALMGCDITVTVSNENASLFLAEAVLAGLEGLLATSLDAPLMPLTPRILIKFVARDFLDVPFEFEVLPGPSTVIEVRHRRDEQLFDNSEDTKRKLLNLIRTVTAYVAAPAGDGKEFVETLIGKERSIGRALLASSTETVIYNILGDKPKIRMSDWKSDGGEVYPLRRSAAWNDEISENRAATAKTVRPTPGTGEPPAGLFDVEQIKHRDRKVVSLVNVDLWNKARWVGTGYITYQDPKAPPLLLLLYEDPESAMYIFTGWQEEVGQEDIHERLRVSIISGISQENPAAYRVVISANPNHSELDERNHMIIVSRIKEMNPENSSNLDRFLEDYDKKKRYILVPAEPGPNGIGGWAPTRGIEKRELNVRPAWQIGEHDPDRVGIKDDDDVIRPEGFAVVPVLGVRESKRQQRKGERSSIGDSAPVTRLQKRIGRNDPCYCGSAKKYKQCHGR